MDQWVVQDHCPTFELRCSPRACTHKSRLACTYRDVNTRPLTNSSTISLSINRMVDSEFSREYHVVMGIFVRDLNSSTYSNDLCLRQHKHRVMPNNWLHSTTMMYESFLTRVRSLRVDQQFLQQGGCQITLEAWRPFSIVNGRSSVCQCLCWI